MSCPENEGPVADPVEWVDSDLTCPEKAGTLRLAMLCEREWAGKWVDGEIKMQHIAVKKLLDYSSYL